MTLVKQLGDFPGYTEVVLGCIKMHGVTDPSTCSCNSLEAPKEEWVNPKPTKTRVVRYAII